MASYQGETKDYAAYNEDDQLLSPDGSPWLIRLISSQADLITNFLITTFSSPSASQPIHHGAKQAKETAIEAAPAQSSLAVLVMRKVGLGCLGALYACLLLAAVLMLAVVVGVGLVRFWVEEPVQLREPLHFDYTQMHPTAVFPVETKSKTKWAVPVGHTLCVSLVLLMPESDFNRHIGIFQVTAEVKSTTGSTLALSSQPCMLPFRSLPVRLMHTFVMGVPLLLGISGETQTITFTILRHKEAYPRTGSIMVTLQPRAGTLGIPQLYSAEIVINSQLPFMKRPVFFPMGAGGRDQRDWSVEEIKDDESRISGEREALIRSSLEKWRRGGIRSSLRRRKARSIPHEIYQERVGSSASSSAVVSRDEVSQVVEDFGGFTDSESVCQSG